MDPFTIALATFGVQKLRGKSTRTALKDAATMFGIGQLGGMAGVPGVQAFGSTSIPGFSGNFIGGPAAGAMGPVPSVGQQVATLPETMTSGIKSLIGTSEVRNPVTGVLETPGSGFMGLSTGAKLGLGLAGASLLSKEEKPEIPPGYTEEDYARQRAKANEQVSNLGSRATYTNTISGSPYDYTSSGMYAFNQGGIVNALPRYATGGINYLPSKTDHDENDVHNYIRAEGYVEDGSGNGNKDEDTILAQLADGEFVSRADAILGAGIMEGASPSNMKDMRKKGAAFFYDQQAKFKRVYDLLNASRKDN